MPADDFARRIAAAARTLHREANTQDVLARTLQLAIDNVDGCEHAGISLVRHEHLESPAVSSEVVLRVDALQYGHQQGPCVEAIVEDEVVYCRDLEHDPRWPVWGPEIAHQTGVRSMLCFRLFTHANTLGALNLYASRVGAFDEHDHDEGLALAANAAMAFAESDEIENLHHALDSRTMIGQAIGMLMERYDMASDQAFSVLKRVSQDSNTKLREVAHQLVTTRRLEDSAPRQEEDRAAVDRGRC